MTTVHVWLPGESEPVVAGEFVHDAMRRTGRFAYGREYLEAGYPAVSPDLPLRAREHVITGGSAIFPLFVDAGPDAWGRHLLARRLERDISELEALTLCPTDGVGNVALGDLTPERLSVLSASDFVAILEELEAGRPADGAFDERVLDAVQNGTSLGGTKPKLTLTVDGDQYLAKFPEQADTPWLPHVEAAMLALSKTCGITATEAAVWPFDGGQRSALLVKRFDRVRGDTGVCRIGYISAHGLLQLDRVAPKAEDSLLYGTRGFDPRALRRSYVSLAADMGKWCGSQVGQRESARELWRRIVFNGLIRNLDDHSKNHGLLCQDMRAGKWGLSPAFDLVAPVIAPPQPALAMAYRYVPAGRKQGGASRLVTRIDMDDLVAAAQESYGYTVTEAKEHFVEAACRVTDSWQSALREQGMPDREVARYAGTFGFAKQIAADYLAARVAVTKDTVEDAQRAAIKAEEQRIGRPIGKHSKEAALVRVRVREEWRAREEAGKDVTAGEVSAPSVVVRRAEHVSQNVAGKGKGGRG